MPQRKIHARDERTERSDRRVQPSVCPAANSVDRRILPGLEAIVVVQIMSRLPEVEDFIAVLDRAIERRNDMAYEEDIESNNGRELEFSSLGSVAR